MLSITNTVVMVIVILAKLFFNWVHPTVLAYNKDMTYVIFKTVDEPPH